MSSVDNLTTARPPTHHVHDTSDPLPGVGGAPPPPDYSTGAMNRTPSSAWNGTQERNPNQTSNFDSTTKPDMNRTHSASGNTAFNTEKPMNVEPTNAGGVAIGGRDDLPEGKASLGDKLIGKTQKVIGKYAHKPEMHEKGELRESGGKAAALGQARAPHD